MRTVYRPQTNAQPRGSYYSADQDMVHLPHLYVHVPDEVWRDSGLLDANGNKLMAKEEREPAGFLAGRLPSAKSR